MRTTAPRTIPRHPPRDSDRGNWIRLASGRRFYLTDPRPGDMLLEETWSREIALAGLLHDAAEAYLPDVTRPLKALLPGFVEIEAGVEDAIAERFGLRRDFRSVIGAMDLRMLATEAVTFGWDISDWDMATRNAEPTRRVVEFLIPIHAAYHFRACFDFLITGRGRR